MPEEGPTRLGLFHHQLGMVVVEFPSEQLQVCKSGSVRAAWTGDSAIRTRDVCEPRPNSVCVCVCACVCV